MKKYSAGNAYAYRLDTIYQHIAWYNEMIDIAAEKLPEVARLATYEEMVEAPSGFVKMAAELCGLPYDLDLELPQIADDRGCSGPYLERLRRH